MKFKNLSAELARAGFSQKQLATGTNIRPETLSKKMRGKSEFTLGECRRIRDFINPELKLEYLFQEFAL